MENVANDWIAVNLHMPEASQVELIDNGITTENTTLQNAEFYKSTKAVKDMFTNPDNGTFDDKAYQKYYDYMAYNYNNFSDKDFTEKAINDVAYHPYNKLRPEGAKVDTEVYKVTSTPNPYRLTMGGKGINVYSDPKFSARELAQMNNVYDSKTGEKLDWKPNDDKHRGLWDFWKNPTLVLGQYDTDGTHYDAAQGREVKHTKGELKTDADGFYYETLGDKEPYNRQVLSWADTLTKEGTWLNDYDFMESDGLDKSIAGVVAKTATKIAPMLIPGFGQVYGLALAGVELLNVVPMIAKAGIGLFVNEDHKEKEYWKKLNKLQGFSKTLSTSSVSDTAMQSIVNVENFGQLIVDVVGQLKSQQGIASIPSMIGMSRKSMAGYGKVVEQYGEGMAQRMAAGSLNAMEKAQIIERIPEAASYINRIVKNIEVARALSTVYMSATSAAQVTEEAKALGLDERDTAALYLGVSLGFFGMMRALPIGEWATRGIGIDDAGNIMKGVIKEKADAFAKQGGRLIENVSKEAAEEVVGAAEKGASKLLNKASKWNTALISKGKEWGQSVAKQLGDPKGYSGAMLAESTEEMTEELMQDSIKGIYNGLSSMGYTSTKDKQFQYGDIKSILARYAMAGFGGAMGGAIFHFGEHGGRGSGLDDENMRKEEVIIRNHGLEGMLKEIDKWESKGIASKTLSFNTVDIELPNGNKKTIFKPATTYTDSQNAIMANVLRERYKRMQNQIFQEGVKTNIELYELYDNRTDALIKTSANSSLIDDYDAITAEILALRSELVQVTTITPDSGEDAVKQATIKASEIQSRLKVKQEELQAIHDGSKFADYQAQALFNINSGWDINGDPDAESMLKRISISEPFVNLSIDSYAIKTKGRPYSKLSAEEKTKLKEEYKVYKDLNIKELLKEGYKRFVTVNTATSLDVQNVAEIVKVIKDKLLYAEQKDLGIPSAENIQAYNEEKSTLSTNNYKDTILNAALDINSPAYTISNRIMALDSINALLSSTDRIPADVADDLKKIVNGFSFKELVVEHHLLDADKGIGDIDEETGEFETFHFPLSSIDSMVANGNASQTLLKEIHASKLNTLDSIFEKYDSMIDATESTPEMKAESKKNLQLIFDRIKSLAAINLEDGSALPVSVLLEEQVKLNKIISSKSFNSLKELISKFELKVNGKKTNIIDLLTEQFESIAKLDELMDYEINDPEILENLEYSLQLLSELNAIIMATTDYQQIPGEFSGYNSTMNKSYPDVQLGVIDQGTSLTLQIEIYALRNRINFLTELSKINSEDKIKNQKESGMIMEALFYENLMDGKALRSYINSVKIHGEAFLDDAAIVTIEQADMIKGVLAAHREKRSAVPTSPELIHKYEAQVLEVQLALHKRLKQLIAKGTGTVEENTKDVMNQLFGVGTNGEMSAAAKAVFPSVDLSHGVSTKFSSTEQAIQPLDLFVWFNTTLTVNPVEFLNQLRGKKNADGTYSGIASSPYAPFYGQEYAAKVVYGMLTNATWIKGVSALLTSSEGFLPTIIKSFSHAVFIDGSPGSGKSSAIVQHLMRMLNDAGVEFWTAAPYLEQAVKLSDVSGHVATKTLDKNDLLLALLNGNTALVEAVSNKENLTKFEGTYKSTPHSLFNLKAEIQEQVRKESPAEVEGLPPVIFIDEVTHFNVAELTAINIALSNMTSPPLLVMLGDTSQNGALHNQDKHNINLFNVWKTPKLDDSIRNSNNHKKKNSDNIKTVNRFVEAQYLAADTTAKDEKVYAEIASKVQEYITSTDENGNEIGLKLHHYTNEAGKVFGEKVISKEELGIGLIRQMVKNLKPDGKLGFITNNLESDIVKAIKSDVELKALVTVLEDKVILKEEAAVQGLEFEDTIVDVDWAKYRESAAFGILNTTNNLNTLVSRSESGTIFVDNNLTNYSTLKITSVGNDSVYPTQLDPTLVSQFKDMRIASIDRLVNGHSDEIVETNPFVSIGGTVVVENTAATTEGSDNLVLQAMMEQDENLPETTATFHPSNLQSYPWYFRFAEDRPSEDAGYLKGTGLTTEEEIKDKLNSIKTAIIHGGANSKEMLITMLEADDELQLNRMKLIIRGSRYNSERDRTHEGYDPKLEAPENSAFLRLVLEIPRTNDVPVYFTVAALGTSKSVEKAGKAGLTEEIRRLETLVTNVIPEDNFDESFDFEILDPDYINNLTASTNVQMERLPEGKYISFSEFKKTAPHATISAPYIMTKEAPVSISKDPELSKRYKNWIQGKGTSTREGKIGLSGKTCCYISYDPNLKDGALLRAAWEEERIKAQTMGKKAPVPKVKMLMLDMKAYAPMEWFEKTQKAISQHKDERRKVVYPLATMAAPAIAKRILNTLIEIEKATKTSTSVADQALNTYLNKVLSNLQTMFAVHNDPHYVALMEFFSKETPIGRDLGHHAEVAQSHYSAKTGEPAVWGQTLEPGDTIKYVAFKNNQLYKLMVGLNVAMLGGVVTVKEGDKKQSLEFQNAFDSCGVHGDEDFLNVLKTKFNTLFTSVPEFKHGIYTHSVFQRSAPNQRNNDIMAAEPAFDAGEDSDFVINAKVSLPNILVNLQKVKPRTEVKENKNAQIKTKLKELEAIIEDQLNGAHPLEETLREMYGEITRIDPEDFATYEDFLEDYNSIKETVDGHINTIQEDLRQTEVDATDPESALKGGDANPFTDEDLLLYINAKAAMVFKHAVGSDVQNIEVLEVIRKNNKIIAHLTGVVGDNNVKMTILVLTDPHDIRVLRTQTIPIPVTLDDITILSKKAGTTIQAMMKDAKSEFNRAMKAGTIGDGANFPSFIDALNTGNLNNLKQILAKNPEYLTTFMAIREDDLVDDIMKLLNEKDTNCFNAPF